MKPLHSLLNRQIKKYFPSGQIPSEIQEFVQAVNQAYFEFDQDRNMLERSLELSSQELFRSNSDLRALFEAFPDVLFRIDRQGTILECKAGKQADLYLPPQQLIGKKIQEGPSGKLRLEFENRIAQVYETKRMVSFEYETKWNQEVHYFEARMIPFIDNQLMVVVRNVDERKKMETQLVQSQKMESVGQLAAGVAHEINNPMGVILGFAQTLVKKAPVGDPIEFPLKSIEREALRCKQLVQDLLTFARGGKTEQSLIDLNSTINGALSLISAQTKVDEVILDKAYDSTLPQVVANPGQIQQVVINLCTNAIDAMDRGGRLTVKTGKVKRDNREWAEICVRDTGHGIPADLKSKIFEPFFTTKEPGKGTGLGLALVYELVQKHDGQISFESEVGKGTVFSVMIPCDKQPDPAL